MSAPVGSIILTGANGTLGLALAEQLLRDHRHYTPVFTVRNASKEDQNTSKLRALISRYNRTDDAVVEQLDLSSLDAVRGFTTNVVSRLHAPSEPLPPIAGIICNAFTWSFNGPQFAANGRELGLQVSHISHFLLVLRLLGHMDKSKDGRPVRIMMLSSETHAYKSIEIPEDTEKMIKPPPDEPGKGTEACLNRYGLAKLCNVMFMYQLNRRLAKDPELSHITALAVDPGMIASSQAFGTAPLPVRFLLHYVLAYLAYVLRYFSNIARVPSDAAADVLAVMLGPKPKGKGHFVVRTEKDSSELSRDEQAQEKVWKACVEWTGLTAEDTALSDWQ